MKKILITAFCAFAGYIGFAQTDGLSYQAIIINNNAQEIPGMDVTGNYLSEGDIALRFTIYDESDQIEYQEEQETTTDKFGMVNLIIGQGEVTGSSPGQWDEIDWDGTPKDLAVELSVEGSGFDEFSRQPLLFIPYAYHRDVYASGTMTVEGETVLNDSFTVANQSLTSLTGDLIVQGTATFEGDTYFETITVADWSLLNGTLTVGDSAMFNSSLSVLNESPTYLSGSLQVDGETNLNSDLNVAGVSTFSDDAYFQDIEVQGTSSLYGPLNVYDENPTWLSGELQVGENTTLDQDLDVEGNTMLNQDLDVAGNTILEGTLTANSTSHLNGQVTIDADVNGNEENYDGYPLRVQGSNQGVAIKLDGLNQNAHNFVTFYDDTGTIHGRIEGQTLEELYLNFDFIWDYAGALVQAALHGAEAGACLASPVPDIAESIVNVTGAITHTANSIEWLVQRELDLGVTYESGGADYAEWLEKENSAEHFSPGDVVGVKSGKISKRIDDPDHILVVSTNPIVLGNIPPAGRSGDFEKVAFLGQVPVRVVGPVNPGDYILPSGNNDGLAMAVDPQELATSDFEQIIGIAWESGSNAALNRINMAIGLNTNDVAQRVAALEEEMSEFRSELAELRAAIQNGSTDNIERSDAASKGEQTVADNRVQAASAQPLTDAEFELWLQENREVIEREMAKMRELLDTMDINYSRDENLVKLLDDPLEALRQMRSGEFMAWLWNSYEERLEKARQ